MNERWLNDIDWVLLGMIKETPRTMAELRSAMGNYDIYDHIMNLKRYGQISRVTGYKNKAIWGYAL